MSHSQPLTAGPVELFSRGLSLSAGSFPVGEGERVVGPMRRGLKVAVLLDGSQTLQLDGLDPVMVDGPALLVAANGGDHLQRRTGITGGSVRCVLMQFDLDFVQREFGTDLARLFNLASPRDAALWARPAGVVLRRLALQIMAEAPVEAPLRRLHLAGKALELGALALNEIVGEKPLRPARLNARTREQIHAVRDMLLEAAQDPPALAELARRSGLNASKLTAAFRAEFGTSVFGYLQEHRLQQAYEAIAGGEESIAVVAFRVGYSPAHFSSLFRKRFGISPSSLRPQRGGWR